MAAKAMDAGQKVLEPAMASSGSSRKMGKVILGTVKGDIHNLGKNLVNVMLRGAGFEVIDIGVDIPAEKFVDAVNTEKAQLIGMSALLTTTMPYMRTTIEALEKAGLKGKVKTIVGGACVTQDYADEIGADGYAENAGAAVGKAKELLGLK
jgi:5-methyltetrahydrofolate--homocysteine methyltransferase